MSEARGGLPIMAFADAGALERWFDAQPADSPGLWIKFAKAGSGVASVSKAQAIDAALCHGWLDGQLDKYDERFFLVRFTPRRARSKWSEVNVKRAGELVAEGRMREGGLAQIAARRLTGDGMRPMLRRARPRCRRTCRPRWTPVLKLPPSSRL